MKEGLVETNDVAVLALCEDVNLHHEVLQLCLVLDGHPLQCRQHPRLPVLSLHTETQRERERERDFIKNTEGNWKRKQSG